MEIGIVQSDWLYKLSDELEEPYFNELQQFLKNEYEGQVIYPKQSDIFNALNLTPYKDVKVVILGQDPYHGVNQAHGLAFSVKSGVDIPPSLKNIFKELESDLGCEIPNHGCLLKWAKQGVLLLNTVLTVRAGAANSHKGKGWEKFTNEIIRQLNLREKPIIFILWGKPAQSKQGLIDSNKHIIIASPHPSPLSAHRGFFGSKPFSKVNQYLKAMNEPEIDWQIEDI
ncbi:uracil-DNA glycosylase [Bacillus massilinigeriensis]|uniref:uracil-DNA glycosylase n=1 Tax=Bacillus massilionigeriensis TaxID=1805475 RepID=UPI00096AEBF4|nr:uracil-DNA glycosylase [Bacillus massilionigeriensis]